MNYQDKYIKYKNKYLKLKKLVGGNQPINFKKNIEIPMISHINIDLINKNDHMLVPMNCYEEVNKDNVSILSTTGFIPCVLVAIYNPKHGRYFAHYLKFNEFIEDLSNSCSILIDKTDCKQIKTIYTKNVPTVKSLSYPGDCDNGSHKITIPKWVNDEDTLIHILNNEDIFHVLSRLKNIKKSIFKGQINVYFHSLDYNDKQILKKEYPILKNEYIESLVHDNKNFSPEIFMMTSNGNIFFAMKDDIKSESNPDLYNFYSSITVNRIASPHDNKKCVNKYSLKKSYFEANRQKYKSIEHIPNIYKDDVKQVTTNSYQIEFFKI